ncbi:alpha-L-fucosidase [Planctomonas sp. JC2975]|uniref:alpha-L-fucosidase n=1 Tax=Planctomonas sp. JC2975 TaxID=2729626 RepID=UPI0014764BE0|nr:alpha-L-fucosidase [Planctomonas sp. JC2975]
MTPNTTSAHAEAPARPQPTTAQREWQRWGLGVFLHVGVNTFADVEWSDGTLAASSFDPADLDARVWLRDAAAAGARYVVLTAKHHDGFCLWPTATTDYSVASSPWRDGRGDLVREVADAAAAEGIGFGVYLSPWDRHERSYADPAAYDDFYVRQLTELCSGYGDLAEIWLDGAGSKGRVYDWDRYMAVIDELQPNAMVFNMGRPSIRWAGNEDGIVDEPVRYAVDSTADSQYTESSTALAAQVYLPPECDVSIRRGWFHSPSDEPKTPEHLLAIWYRSVGRGANLLLNVPPTPSGGLDAADVAALGAFAAERERRFGAPVVGTLSGGFEPGVVHVALPHPVAVRHVDLVERLDDGQRIGRHEVRVDGRVVASGSSVGARRIHLVDLVETDAIDIWLDDGELESVAVHTGDRTMTVPDLPEGYEAPTLTPDELAALKAAG